MGLPYVRQIRFLSPSSLWEFENRPIQFYLKRLGPVELKPEPFVQTKPMAVGTVFDAHVKSYLGHMIEAPVPEAMHLIKDNVDPIHMDPDSDVLAEGLRIFRAYTKSPALKYLIEDGLDGVEVPTETVTVGDHQLIGREFGGVPIYGKPDAKMTKDDKTVILDWKVNGSFSEKGASPHTGYLRLWDQGFDIGPHKYHGRYLEDINAQWATQTVMYDWMLSDEVDISTPAQCAIEQIVVTPDRIRFAQIRAAVSPGFQSKVMVRLKEAWAAIQEGRVVDEDSYGTDPEFLQLVA